ncbi:MAG: galactitol-1-phosphate 5-dehydrogenase [Armatimonadota bacterium]|nr:MAG: galactitol-1-phosphate 5-dehydrogenase [Armatimonadota bacterium]
MRALILEEYGRLVYGNVPDPPVGPHDALVQVKACGICGSDVHGVDGSTGRRRPPIVMGHEASGVIAQVGAEVAEWKTGDRVTFDSTISCGKCHFCRRGQVNLCDSRSVLGVSCDEYRRDGAFAEYVAVPERILYRIPDELSFEHAAMVEPLSVAFHAVGRIPISVNDTAVVVGAGMIGLLALQVLRAAGCGTIIAVDLEEDRLDLARGLGADVGLRADACNVVEEVRRRSDGRGADLAFEAVGMPQTMETAVQCLRKGGSLALVGNLSPTVQLPLQAVVARELSLYGSYAARGEYPACLDMIARGAVKLEPLISAAAPLSEGAAWFERLRSKEPGLMKVILRP